MRIHRAEGCGLKEIVPLDVLGKSQKSWQYLCDGEEQVYIVGEEGQLWRSKILNMGNQIVF